MNISKSYHAGWVKLIQVKEFERTGVVCSLCLQDISHGKSYRHLDSTCMRKQNLHHGVWCEQILSLFLYKARSRSDTQTVTADMYSQYSLKRNLIRNPSAAEGLNNWKIDENGGTGWKVEENLTEKECIFPNPSVQKLFATSSQICKKSQLIDLKEAGYSDEVMDTYQPDIVATDWYQSRPDCGCQYELAVKLLSADKKTVQEFVPAPIIIKEKSDIHWRHITHTFSKYGPGVRYISFQHGGKDTKNWAGAYGVRLTNSSVSIEL
ncbi:PREDICTED: F-box only protein 44-like [Nanorana parkeri]|uniref:F-box only protein 44-like n=1 Tax=Nanorana parkeri TaxID=125878 RepID=UPI00085459F9|nr:PREDICTED: F-box only protein 44-like [Nanorana parkeri]